MDTGEHHMPIYMTLSQAAPEKAAFNQPHCALEQ